MVICVSEELSYLQDELTKRGYTVINNRDNNVSCDAIICNLKNGGLMNLNMQNNIKREGTLIIDIGSKTIEEIEYILTTRVYSSIF
ncbi:YkuS family protein [Clostridium lacusfryxellense]|uniref:YkuS family protein n=1 Tax=Clostridium lacusfryxellense TaxID=205328 RepID=UPI001C0D6F4E|nr:YkuS family protein [Clostridium lacusfryxellense]MBU3110498.1 YkuS family protein [Clostridium lacusfryxellense]